MEIVKILILGKRPQSDSYNEPSLDAHLYFKDGKSLYVNMLGKTVYHLPHYYPNVEIEYTGA